MTSAKEALETNDTLINEWCTDISNKCRDHFRGMVKRPVPGIFKEVLVSVFIYAYNRGKAVGEDRRKEDISRLVEATKHNIENAALSREEYERKIKNELLKESVDDVNQRLDKVERLSTLNANDIKELVDEYPGEFDTKLLQTEAALYGRIQEVETVLETQVDLVNKLSATIDYHEDTFHDTSANVKEHLAQRIDQLETIVKNLASPSIDALNTLEKFVEGRFDTHIEAFHDTHIEAFHSHQVRPRTDKTPDRRGDPADR